MSARFIVGKSTDRVYPWVVRDEHKRNRAGYGIVLVYCATEWRARLMAALYEADR